MGKLISFTFITLNGFFKGLNEDVTWHIHGGEEAEYSAENLKSGNTLLFGRVTYEMMATFWPTPMAFELFPEVAQGLHDATKIVVSRTLTATNWANTKIMGGDLMEEVPQLKQSSASDITLLGSGSILTQLLEARLVDELQIMLDPVVIGQGTPIFDQLNPKVELTLIKNRPFKNGVMLLYYKPNY